MAASPGGVGEHASCNYAATAASMLQQLLRYLEVAHQLSARTMQAFGVAGCALVVSGLVFVVPDS